MGAVKYLKVRCPYCQTLVGVQYLNMHVVKYHRDSVGRIDPRKIYEAQGGDL